MRVSDSMKIHENVNVPRMLTRHTTAHTQHSAVSTFPSLVSMPVLFLKHMPESLTRQWIRDFTIFDACANNLLVHVWCVFFIYESLSINQQTLKQSLTPSPGPHFQFAHAITPFEMLLWPMTYWETLIAALGFCCDCLENISETDITVPHFLCF